MTRRLHPWTVLATLATLLVATATLPAIAQDWSAPLPPSEPWSGGSRALVRPASDPWITPAEASGFATTPSYEETVAWLQRLAAAAPQLRLLSLGKSGEGRDIWMVVASQGGAGTPQELRANGRPTLLAQGGIHAGEIDGKDAGLMLLRDLTVGGRLDLLSRVNLLFVPILNTDGHERRAALSRINQRGPDNAGWRTTARNLNLNRDYTKLDAPETRAVVAALRAWEPDLYFDLHVTDGGDYQYDITFGGGERGGWSPAIEEWLESRLRPDLDAALRQAGHVPGPLWVANLLDPTNPLAGYSEWPLRPMLSHGYGDARHLPTVLVENHSLKPYDRRVLGTYVLLEATLRHLAARADGLRQATTADRTRREPRVMLARRMSERPDEVEVLGIGWRTEPSAASGGTRMVWTGEPRTFRAPLTRVGPAAVTAPRPVAYWIPPAWSDVIERLAWHGIAMGRLAAPREVEVEACRLTGVSLAAQAFEGRVGLAGALAEPWARQGAPETAGCTVERRRERLPAGSARVTTDQPLGELAMLLLEPGSPDSYLRWGFFHEILQRTEYVEGYAMEPLAERMLAADPALRADYERALAADPALAKDPQARLAWLYRKTPWADDRYLLYPVFREVGSGGGGGTAALPASPAGAPLVDHHVHLLSAELVRDWKSLGVTFSRPDEVYVSPASLLGAPGERRVGAAIDGAVLVPMAHLYGHSELRAGLGLSLAEERARVAHENDHVAKQAALYPGRAVALCSVSALRPYAREELARCHRELGSAGVKLHLASSEVDLRNAEHLAAVEEIAAWAEREGLPLLLHLDTQRRGTEVAHVRDFVRTVLEPHPRLTVVVAHLGGSGGYGEWTRSVFHTLLGWLGERSAAGDAREHVYFEVSTALLERESEGVPATTPQEGAQLGGDLIDAGLERIVFGSDYPVFDPRRGAAALVERTGLSAAEVAAIAANRVPGLLADGASAGGG